MFGKLCCSQGSCRATFLVHNVSLELLKWIPYLTNLTFLWNNKLDSEVVSVVPSQLISAKLFWFQHCQLSQTLSNSVWVENKAIALGSTSTRPKCSWASPAWLPARLSYFVILPPCCSAHVCALSPVPAQRWHHVAPLLIITALSVA